MSSGRVTRYFTTNDASEDISEMLNIFYVVKKGEGSTLCDIHRSSGLSKEILSAKLNLCAEKKIMEMSRKQEDTGDCNATCVQTDGKGFLGISFDGESCSLTVLDPRGEVVRKEVLAIPLLGTLRGRVGEIKEIVKQVAKLTSFKGIPLRLGGVVINSLMEGKEKKGVAIVAEGLSRAFKCEIIVAKRATAASYAEKQLNPFLKEKSMLYLHTDSGEGVLIERENITESRAPGKGKESYLRAWDQFDAVRTAKELLRKGMGTDIVSLVGANVDSVSISEVLKAAEKGDELAEDLVKRSALALGVRAAYLSNIFNIDVIVLGGGIEAEEGGFKEHMKKSFRKFLLNEKKDRIEVVGGVVGDEIYSLGAALLCRREIFAEVR